MKFLLDQNVPIVLVNWLDKRGYQALHTKGSQLQRLTDRELVSWCRGRVDVLVTKDADFRVLLPASIHDPLQLVHLKGGNSSNADFLDWFGARWANILANLEANEQVIEVI